MAPYVTGMGPTDGATAPPEGASVGYPHISPHWEGAAITNVCGVPGSVACLARTLHEQRLVLVTTYHALFAAGARCHAPVSAVLRGAGSYQFRHIGTSGWGKRGTVRFAGADVFVDCAVVDVDESSVVPPGWRVADEEISETNPPAVGEPVLKTGAATGTTEGTVVAVEHDVEARTDGRVWPAPQQILVRARMGDQAFSVAGDSGSALRNARGALVGLIWGVTSAGESVACPIAPVLWVLHVQPVRLLTIQPLSPATRAF